MKKNKIIYLILLCLTTLVFYSCGDKFDISEFNTDNAGNISGDTIYVKLNPDWTGFNKPQDIIVGREPLIYVADTENNSVVMLNLDGARLGSITVPRPIAIAQDYKLNLIVCGEFDTLGQTYSAVYKIDLVSVNHQITNAPIRRILPRLDDLNSPSRLYTAACVFYDNSFYVARTGPNNSSIYDPDNSILLFRPKNIDNFNSGDTLIGRVPNISATSSGLVSANQISSLSSFNNTSIDLVVSLTGDNSFKTQWWNYEITPIDERYQSVFTPSDGVDFAKPNNFDRPEGSTIDENGNIFIADAGKDSVFKYNSLGAKLIGFGGPTLFNEPYAVAFFDKVLYVADTGNNRIVRYILSTDL